MPVLLSVLEVASAIQELDDERGLDQRAYQESVHSRLFSGDGDLKLFVSLDLPARDGTKMKGLSRGVLKTTAGFVVAFALASNQDVQLPRLWPGEQCLVKCSQLFKDVMTFLVALVHRQLELYIDLLEVSEVVVELGTG